MSMELYYYAICHLHDHWKLLMEPDCVAVLDPIQN
jgi:hypothetical protein